MSSKTIKIVIVGDGQCGKTSLWSALQNKPFNQTYNPTVFENYETNIDIDGQEVKLVLCDTTGKPDCDKFRALSYYHASLVIICFSIESPESLQRVQDEWNNEVRHFCTGKPVILMGNKADLRFQNNEPLQGPSHGQGQGHSRSVVSWMEGAEMSRNIRAIRYRECSAKTGQGIKEVLETAVKAALEFPNNQSGSITDLNQIITQSTRNKPADEINLILLGQSGGGKTTFLNSFHTYLSYESFEEAVADSQFKTLTRMKFTMMDVDLESQGQQGSSSNHGENNENYDMPGQTVTQHPIVHTFVVGDMKVRIIDTPGIGDFRGSAQDDKNINQLVHVLKTMNNIHGVLILLNPNQSRSDLTFDYCLQQLLLNLPRQAVDNLVFIFTKAQKWRLFDNDTKKLLQNFFQNIQDRQGVVIPMKKENTFYFDNVVIPYILQTKSPYFDKDDFHEEDAEFVNTSWRNCSLEMGRLFIHLHNIRTRTSVTLTSIMDARSLVKILEGPLLEICRVIDNHLQVMENLEREILDNLNETKWLRSRDKKTSIAEKLADKSAELKDLKEARDEIFLAIMAFSEFLQRNAISFNFDNYYDFQHRFNVIFSQEWRESKWLDLGSIDNIVQKYLDRIKRQQQGPQDKAGECKSQGSWGLKERVKSVGINHQEGIQQVVDHLCRLKIQGPIIKELLDQNGYFTDPDTTTKTKGYSKQLYETCVSITGSTSPLVRTIRDIAEGQVPTVQQVVNGSKQPDINLILLGQPRVGKTTLLDSIHAYLSYKTFADVLADTQYITPSQMNSIGNPSSDPPKAVPENLTFHHLEIDDLKIQIIDTPGVGDPGKAAQDKESLKDVLQIVKAVEIHGFLILLDPNEDDLLKTLAFEHILQQILLNVPKLHVHNLMFLFTKVDLVGTHNQLSHKAQSLIEDLFRNMQGEGSIFPMEKEKIFYFNNVVIPYILTAKKFSSHIKNEALDEHMLEFLNRSWRDGAMEMKRLFKHLHHAHSLSLNVGPNLKSNFLRTSPTSSSDVKGICPQYSSTELGLASSDYSSSNSSSNSDLPAINLLILGQTGVGKTTFLNSFHTHLSYEHLEDAVEDPQYNTLTQMKFTMNDRDLESPGLVTDFQNEKYGKEGDSVTQYPFCQTFIIENLKIRIIDTPGFGDTRGFTKDEEHFTELLKALQGVEEIHGILILMKTTQCRHDLTFDHCLQQLLINLPKQSVDNFIFVFTNADKVGGRMFCDTKKMLKNCFDNIQESRGVNIPMEKNNTFFFDNVAIQYILLQRHPSFTDGDLDEDDIEFLQSRWKNCGKEMQRLFEYLNSTRPVPTTTLLSIKSARTLVENLQGPLHQMCKVLDTQIEERTSLEKEIKKSLGDYDFERLVEKKLLTTTFTWTKLKEPRVLCRKCSINVLTVEGEKKPFNSGICCDGCTVPSFLGVFCQSMRLWGWKCGVCECSWKAHSKDESTSTKKETVDQKLSDEVEAALSSTEKLAVVSQNLEDLKKEKEMILKSLIAFHRFLQENSISHQSDATKKFLQEIIKKEKEEPNGLDLKELSEMLKSYEEMDKNEQGAAKGQGQNQGQDRDQNQGQDQGQDRGQNQGQDRGQNQGQDRGQNQGQDRGQNQGQDRGQNQGQDRGQDSDNKHTKILDSICINGPEEIQKVLSLLCALKWMGPEITKVLQQTTMMTNEERKSGAKKYPKTIYQYCLSIVKNLGSPLVTTIKNTVTTLGGLKQKQVTDASIEIGMDAAASCS